MSLVSIITVCYNSAATVADCLKSVSIQKYPDIEHIIIDGESRDETLEIINSFPHISRLISEPDRGIYDAMNKGICLANGEIIGILNSDDMYIDAEVISDIVSCFRDSNVMAVYADLEYVDTQAIQLVKRSWKSGSYSAQNFFYGWMPPHPTFFVRREVYEKYGRFNTNFTSSADYEFMLRCLVKFEINATYLPRKIVRMRTGGQSNASFRNRWRANREDRRAWDVNGLTPYFFTIPLKPVRKILQFLVK